MADLEAWHATLHVRPGETQDRLKALETQVTELFDLWQRTRAAMDNLDTLQEHSKVKVTNQLNKFVTILREKDEHLEKLTAHVEALEGRLEELQATRPMKKMQPQIETTALPEGFMYLSDFCTIHHVPYGAAGILFPRAIRGQKIKVGRRNYAMIGPKGQRDFSIQLHTRDDFVTCDDCPHEESGQSV